MRRVGQARRRDTVERAIVDALKAIGCDVTRVSGPGAPDILVRRQGRLQGFEIKSHGGKRTPAQEQTQWPILRSVEEALAAITTRGGER